LRPGFPACIGHSRQPQDDKTPEAEVTRLPLRFQKLKSNGHFQFTAFSRFLRPRVELLHGAIADFLSIKQVFR